MSCSNDDVAFLDAFAAGCDGNIDPLVSFELEALLSSSATSPLELDAKSFVDEFESSVDALPHQQQQSITSYFKSSKTGATFSHEEDLALLRCYTERGTLDGVVGRRFKTHKLPQLRQRLDELVKELVENRLSEERPNVATHDVGDDAAAAPTTPTPPLPGHAKQTQIDTDGEPATIAHSRSRKLPDDNAVGAFPAIDIATATSPSIEADSKDVNTPKKRRKPETARKASKKMKNTSTFVEPPTATTKAVVNYGISFEYSHTFCDRSTMRSKFGAINKRLETQTNPENRPTLPMILDVACYDEELDG